MRRIIIALALFAVALGGCGNSCTPAPAYTIPAHWSRAYYSNEQDLLYYRTYSTYGRSCSGSGRYRSCYTTRYSHSVPVYRFYEQYHPAVYHPSQYVPRVYCNKGTGIDFRSSRSKPLH